MSGTYAPRANPRLPHASVWLIVLAAVAGLVVAVGTGVLVGRATKDAEPVAGLASERAVMRFERAIGDGFGGFATYFADDAVFEEPDFHRRVEGPRAIFALTGTIGRMGDCAGRANVVPIQTGNRVALVYGTCDGKDTFVDVVRFNEEMKISHWWSIGDGFTQFSGHQP